MILILIFLVSLAPPTLIFLGLRKRHGVEDGVYRNICNRTFWSGAIWCPLVLIVVDGTLSIIRLALVKTGVMSTLGKELYEDILMNGLVEEVLKYMAFKRMLKKYPYEYSSLDVISLMMIVGIGFGLMESFFYAAGANAGMMLVRGITAMHCGYGFIMGCFLAKGMKTGDKKYTVLGLLIPFVLHATYDACLGDAVDKINSNFMFVSGALAVVAIITLVVAIVFFVKNSKNPELNASLSLRFESWTAPKTPAASVGNDNVAMTDDMNLSQAIEAQAKADAEAVADSEKSDSANADGE